MGSTVLSALDKNTLTSNTHKNASIDIHALNKVQLSASSAKRKLVDGLAKEFSLELAEVLRNKIYCLNLDEATNKNNKDKLFTILVSYFSSELGETRIHHLDTIRVLNCKANTMLAALEEVFDKHDPDWENLLAMMTDNCPAMKGEINGLEKQVKEKKQPNCHDKWSSGLWRWKWQVVGTASQSHEAESIRRAEGYS